LNSLLCDYFCETPFAVSFRSMICFGCATVPVSLAFFNKHVIHGMTDNKIEFAPSPKVSFSQPTLVSEDTRTLLNKSIAARVFETIQALLDFVIQHLVQPGTDTTDDESINIINSYNRIHCMKAWKRAILGWKPEKRKSRKQSSQLPEAVTLEQLPTMLELKNRIEISLRFSLVQKSLGEPLHRFYTGKSGSAWARVASDIGDDEPDDYRALSLQACSEFPAFLNERLKNAGMYLDELAGIGPLPSHPDIEAAITALMKQVPAGRVQKIDLNIPLGDGGTKLGGTVLAGHQILSPKFLAYWLVDHDSACSYMKDVRSMHKKDRYIRIASTLHETSKPVWMKFGDETNIYLYLSQKASAAEEKWICIVNFVMKLLCTFVNQYIRKNANGPVPSDELMRLRVFDTAVSNTGHPNDSDYGLHTDAKHGLVDQEDPKRNSFNLIVPTLCIQNHSVASTRVEWLGNEDDPLRADSVRGSILQEFCLFHLQLLGVQEFFRHRVSPLYHRLTFNLCFIIIAKCYDTFPNTLYSCTCFFIFSIGYYYARSLHSPSPVFSVLFRHKTTGRHCHTAGR
jgi:hypothetical protein